LGPGSIMRERLTRGKTGGPLEKIWLRERGGYGRKRLWGDPGGKLPGNRGVTLKNGSRETTTGEKGGTPGGPRVRGGGPHRGAPEGGEVINPGEAGAPKNGLFTQHPRPQRGGGTHPK